MSQFCVAIIGGIGCGKSTVASFFKQLGCDLISADAIAKALTASIEIKTILKQHFGNDIFDENDVLDRKKLGNIVFNNTQKKTVLENVLHPKIRTEMANEVLASNKPYCVVEIPLLQNREDFPYVNRVLFVKAPLEQRIAQVIARDKKTTQEVQTIINQQMSDKTRAQLADDVIENDSTLEVLKTKCAVLHKTYLQDAVAN